MNFPKLHALLLALALASSSPTSGQELPAHVESDPALKSARQLLAAKHFAEALTAFRAYVTTHPDSTDGRLGVADCQLALHQYEAAELSYRALVASQPQLWLAHKNLVVVEAALGRWEDFDREREILHDARRRGAAGISTRESDVIDTLDAAGQHWIVRAYDEPAGRSLTRYNFERFSPSGHVEAFLSLESATAAEQMLASPESSASAAPTPANGFALNWYNGRAHGTIRRYSGPEPSYEHVRVDALRWIRNQPPISHSTAPM